MLRALIEAAIQTKVWNVQWLNECQGCKVFGILYLDSQNTFRIFITKDKNEYKVTTITC